MPANYYPPLSLKDAIRLARLIKETNAGHPMFRITCADELGLKDGAMAFRDLITASNRYGLTKGSYKAEKLELTEKADPVIKHDHAAVLDILFSNEYFSKVHQRYANSIVPSDKVVEDYLKELKVGAHFIAGVRKVIFQNMRDWGLIQQKGGGERILPREMVQALAGPSSEDESPTKSDSTMVENIVEKPEGTSGQPQFPNGRPKVTVSPNLQVNIEIHIAADTPHETIEKIFESMGKHLVSNGASAN